MLHTPWYVKPIRYYPVFPQAIPNTRVDHLRVTHPFATLKVPKDLYRSTCMLKTRRQRSFCQDLTLHDMLHSSEEELFLIDQVQPIIFFTKMLTGSIASTHHPYRRLAVALYTPVHTRVSFPSLICAKELLLPQPSPSVSAGTATVALLKQLCQYVYRTVATLPCSLSRRVRLLHCLRHSSYPPQRQAGI